MANEIAKTTKNEVQKTFDDKLTDNLLAVENALPNDFNRTRFVQNAMSVVTSNPTLMKANQTQLMTGLLRGAYLGLDFMNGECHLVPYGGQIVFIPGYKGLRKFVLKYSIKPLKDLEAEVIRDGDYIDYGIKDNKPYLEFKPKPLNNSKVIGAFAIAYYENGDIVYTVLNMDELNKVRNASKCGKLPSSPWVTWTEEMYKKSCVSRLAKSISTDFENKEMQDAWNKSQSDEFENNNSFERGEVVNAFAKKEDEIVIDSTVVDIPEVENFK